MVRIRLRRMGAKKKPFYRIVVADKRSPRDGRFIETIGSYNPRTEPETVVLQHARAAYWLGVGAQPSDSVARLLKSENLLDGNGKPVPYDDTVTEEVGEIVEESVASVSTGTDDATVTAEAYVVANEEDSRDDMIQDAAVDDPDSEDGENADG